jgi:tRNA (cmo5U34)-methyltransferase
MSDFKQSEWSNPEAADFFIDNSSRYIPDRTRNKEVLISLVSHVLIPRFSNTNITVLELGCGDGTISHALKLHYPNLILTLLDGSTKMLNAARKRICVLCEQYIQSTFQDILCSKIDLGKYHFIVSSLAIHHLTLSEKSQLFSYIIRSLYPGGVFVNSDVILSPTNFLEDWYLALWRDWIVENDLTVADGKSFKHIPLQYKQNKDNLPDTILDQLSELNRNGFESVDVFYKNGLFAVYGGFKPL